MNQSDSANAQNPSYLELHRRNLAVEKAERDAKTSVYFIQAQTVGLIKVGIAVDPNARLAALQIGSPDKLRLLGVIRTIRAAALESTLHAEMAEHHSHGEWFRPSPFLLDYIAQHATPGSP